MAKSHRIAVLGGDGIGPEVTRERSRRSSSRPSSRASRFELRDYPFGAEHYLKTKETLPAVRARGDPRTWTRSCSARSAIRASRSASSSARSSRGLRFGLDLYVNLRPVKLYAERLCPLKDKRPEDVDMVVVRENTEDVYAGIGGFFKKGTPDEVAIQEMIFTRKGVERVIRYAFDLARKRPARRSSR